MAGTSHQERSSLRALVSAADPAALAVAVEPSVPPIAAEVIVAVAAAAVVAAAETPPAPSPQPPSSSGHISLRPGGARCSPPFLRPNCPFFPPQQPRLPAPRPLLGMGFLRVGASSPSAPPPRSLGGSLGQAKAALLSAGAAAAKTHLFPPPTPLWPQLAAAATVAWSRQRFKKQARAPLSIRRRRNRWGSGGEGRERRRKGAGLGPDGRGVVRNRDLRLLRTSSALDQALHPGEGGARVWRGEKGTGRLRVEQGAEPGS